MGYHSCISLYLPSAPIIFLPKLYSMLLEVLGESHSEVFYVIEGLGGHIQKCLGLFLALSRWVMRTKWDVRIEPELSGCKASALSTVISTSPLPRLFSKNINCFCTGDYPNLRVIVREKYISPYFHLFWSVLGKCRSFLDQTLQGVLWVPLESGCRFQLLWWIIIVSVY